MVEFLVKFNGEVINTFNGNPTDPYDDTERDRLLRKYGVVLYPEVFKDNTFYKFDTMVDGGGKLLVLKIFKGHYTGRTPDNAPIAPTEHIQKNGVITVKTNELIEWEEVYIALAGSTGGFLEAGKRNIEDWHVSFSIMYSYLSRRGKIDLLELTPGSMRRVREVFPTALSPNALDFFVKIKENKQLQSTFKRFDTSLFKSRPLPKISKYVGKECDSSRYGGHVIHYAWQSEILIGSIPFLDIVVISGIVTDGVMNIEEKHRYFLTENYAYSPDGGDLAVFVSPYLKGNVHIKHLRRIKSNLMLDKYDGKYFYSYLLSRHFLPAFEILAKAGYTLLADFVLEQYWRGDEADYWKKSSGRLKFYYIKYFGKNDREIFGFRLKHLSFITSEVIESIGCNRWNIHILDFLYTIREVSEKAPEVLKQPVDLNIFNYISWALKEPNLNKRVAYLRRIGTKHYRLYMDYLRMCKDIGHYTKGQGEYPKDLKMAHDVMVITTRQVKEARKNQQFIDVVSDQEYQSLVYEPKDESEEYCILAPRDANDLVQESYRLSHCVRAYIWDVTEKYTRIYFLRKRNQKAKPLVTIEVFEGEVVQARGRANRRISDDEKAFLKKWAKINGLGWGV